MNEISSIRFSRLWHLHEIQVKLNEIEHAIPNIAGTTAENTLIESYLFERARVLQAEIELEMKSLNIKPAMNNNCPVWFDTEPVIQEFITRLCALPLYQQELKK